MNDPTNQNREVGAEYGEDGKRWRGWRWGRGSALLNMAETTDDTYGSTVVDEELDCVARFSSRHFFVASGVLGSGAWVWGERWVELFVKGVYSNF